MTPQEKAKEIYSKFFRTTPQPYYNEKHDELNFEIWDKDWTTKMAKEHSLIAIDEIISQWEYINTYLADLGGELNPNLKYWYEVKKFLNEIN
jgi:hypothetical protein